MDYIIIGCIAFVFQYIFDLNKLFNIHRSFNIFFAIGNLLVAAATIGILVSNGPGFHPPIVLQILFSILAIISFVIMIYSLFFALPFKKTYVDMGPVELIDTGMWALCRHVWVVWFVFLYIFCWLASGKMMMFYAGVIWTVFNVIHVYIQDRWIFPHTLPGYYRYKKEVPFLIPTRKSIRRCLDTFRY